MKKRYLIIFLLVFLNLIITAEVVTLPDVLQSHDIRVAQDKIYIADHYNILIYSAVDYKLLAKIGKKGEGPGEFKRWPDIWVLGEYIIVDDQSKILWFSKDGKYLKEKRVPLQHTVLPIKDHFFALKRLYEYTPGKDRVVFYIVILDKELKQKKTIYERFIRESKSESKLVKQDIQMVSPHFSVDTDGENIYVADSSKGFYIDVFSAGGDHLYTIKKKLDKVKLTQEFKDLKLAEWKGTKLWKENKRNFNYIFPEHFPDMRSFRVADKKLYVTTFKKKDGKSEFIILDCKGKILKKVWLNAEGPYHFSNNKHYNLVENLEKEEYELHVTPIDMK